MSYNKEEIAISVRNLKKTYKIFETPVQRFSYYMFRKQNGNDFNALDDISFEIKKGEAFGIIGRNGSGKSTLLQILSGIIKETEGEVIVNGKIAALLELGSGFNPESTGIENIYMNAAILGVSKEKIEEKINEIIEFADIGEFVHQPVKTYSSGMYVRLAFSVAINVDADILLIDEALAVGDVFFRQKCYTKLNQLKAEGKTIILVSHGMNEVEQFCDRVLLLNKSKVVMVGKSREAVQLYYMYEQDKNNFVQSSEDIVNMQESNFISSNFKVWEKKTELKYNCIIDHEKEINSGKVEFCELGIFDEKGNASKVFCQGEYAYFSFRLRILEKCRAPLFGIVFYDQRNTIIYGKDNLQTEQEIPAILQKGTVVECLYKIKMDIAIGEYTFDIGFNTIDIEEYRNRSMLSQEEINAKIERLSCLPNVGNFSIHERKIGNPMKNSFHGCADLPTELELIVSE